MSLHVDCSSLSLTSVQNKVHIDPDLALVLGCGTIVLTPWFWHAAVSQTNARNARGGLAGMYSIFQQGD